MKSRAMFVREGTSLQTLRQGALTQLLHLHTFMGPCSNRTSQTVCQMEFSTFFGAPGNGPGTTGLASGPLPEAWCRYLVQKDHCSQTSVAGSVLGTTVHDLATSQSALVGLWCWAVFCVFAAPSIGAVSTTPLS